MHQLKMGLAALLLVLAPIPAPRAADPAPAEAIEAVRVIAVEGDVSINADGAVADYRVDTPAPGDTAAKVQAIARGWHFEPVVVDGKARAVVARMRVALAATKSGESYQIRVDDVTFPCLVRQARERAKLEGSAPSLPEDVKRPIYPRGLERAGVNGRVLVAMRYDASGKVTDVAALQSMLFDVEERDHVAARAIDVFERAALSAVRDWQLVMPAVASDQPRIAITAIEFTMEHGDKRHAEDAYPGLWRMVSRTPKRRVEWMDAGRTGTPSVTDVAGGSLVPLADAPLKLRDAVVGTLL